MVLFSKRLKQLRTDANLTQEELGKEINMTKSAICSYEKGNRMAPMDTLIKIANYFKVDLDYLIGTEIYVVSDSGETTRMASEEINIITEIKKHPELYKMFIEDSKRTIELIEKKIR